MSSRRQDSSVLVNPGVAFIRRLSFIAFVPEEFHSFSLFDLGPPPHLQSLTLTPSSFSSSSDGFFSGSPFPSTAFVRRRFAPGDGDNTKTDKIFPVILDSEM